MLIAITSKHVARIFPEITSMYNNQKAWPNIYSDEKNSKKNDNIPIYKNGQFLFYKSKTGTCYFNSSPCTHYFYQTDFTIDEINLKIFAGYKFFYFNKSSN